MKFYNKKFKEIRIKRNIKLTELASALDKNRNTLWLWESGRSIPSESMIRKLSAITNIPLNKISNLKPHENQTAMVDRENINRTIMSAANLHIREQENIQEYFLEKIKEQFNVLNPVVSLVSTFLNSIPVICYSKDITGHYTIVNTAFLKNLSLENSHNVLGKTDFDFFTKKEAELNSDEDEKVVRKVIKIEKEGVIPGSRKKKWGLISKIPIFDYDGKIIGMIGYFVDITKRKEAEKSIRTFVEALNNMEESVWIAKHAKSKTDGGILFDDFLYTVNSGLIKKIFKSSELKNIKSMYDMIQNMTFDYKNLKSDLLPELIEKGFVEIRFKLKAVDGQIYDIKNKIYYDDDNKLFITLSGEDGEMKLIEKMTQKLRNLGVKEEIIQETVSDLI